MKKIYIGVIIVVISSFLQNVFAQCSAGQSEITHNDCSVTTTPGWTFTNGTGIIIQQGGYWLVEKPTDVIVSDSYTVNGTVTVRFKTATYGGAGTGTNNIIIAEYSVGAGWVTLGNTANPTSSSYVNSVLTISGVISSSAFQIRFRNTSSKNQGIRLQDIYICETPNVCTAPTTQASAITFSNVTTNSMDVNWTNGNGGGRIVVMNATNSFTAPTDGANPAASLAYGGSGEQVVFNGTGSGPISITGLLPATTYFYRVYEYCTPDKTYQTASATNNPNSQATAAATAPVLGISGTPTDHGSVCPTVAATPVQYTISNASSVAATGVTVVSDDPQFVVSGAPTTVAANSTATFTVTFTPSSAGPQSATLTVASTTSGSNSPFISLSGTGLTPVTQAVSSAAASAVVNTTATLNGDVTALGVCPATTSKGFVYSVTATNGNPLNGVSGVTTTSVGTPTTGAYTLPLTGLAPNTQYSFKPYVFDGTTYIYGTVRSFTTLFAADHLTLVAVPTTGNVGTPLTSFTIEARRPDNTVDVEYTGNISIAKATGAGALSGTLTVAAVAGVSTFSTAQFNLADTYKITASAGGLTSATSGDIVITLTASVIAAWDFFGQSSPATFAATTFNVNLDANATLSNITRGAGAASSAGSNSFRTTGFSNDGIAVTNTDYFQTTLKTINNYSLSLSTITANVVGTNTYSASPGVFNQFAYSLDGTNFILIGSPVNVTGTTPAVMPSIDVTSVSALQNIVAGTTVYFRYYASGKTTTGGWGFSSTAAGTNGLAFSGFLNPGCTPAIDPTGTVSAGANPSCGPTTVTYSSPGATIYWQASATGTDLTYPTTTAFPVSVTGTTVYARVYDGTCWSIGTVNTGSITISTQPTITTQPTDKTVTSPTGTTFTIVAPDAAGYQWQYFNGTAWTDATGGIYTGGTTATLTLTSTTEGMDGTDYRCIVSATAPCTDVISGIATLYVGPGPCIDQHFVTTIAPAGWILAGGAAISNAQACSNNAVVFSGTNQSVVTEAITNPQKLNFNKNRSSNSDAWSMKIEIGTTNSGPWTLVTTAARGAASCEANPEIDLSAFTGVRYIKFTDTRGSGGAQRAIDDITITCGTTCTPVHSITSILPESGPVGAHVTITGTNFTAPDVSAVKFGSVNASSFTVVNSTTIIAVVPPNAGSENILVTKSGCAAQSPVPFTLLSESGTCGSGSGSTYATDLFISEIYDANSGSLTYVEIFNGTGSPVTMTDVYSLEVRSQTSDEIYPLTGTIASNTTQIMKIGNSSSSCSLTPAWDYPGGAGINGNDEILLLKNSAVLDYAPNPDFYDGSEYKGFSQKRKSTATAPKATSSSTELFNDWTISGSENCGNLGTGPYTVTGSFVTITTPPSDVTCNTIITLTVGASSAPTNTPVYVWKFNDPATMSGWGNVSDLPTLYPGVLVTAPGLNTVTISGITAGLQNFQFYVEVKSPGSPQCIQSSNAAQYFYNTKPLYRSNVTTGNWSAPGSWQMYDPGSATWINVCNYPTSQNSDEVVIRNTNTITLDVNNSIDKLTVDPGGVLATVANSKLSILNGSSGADFIINGTYIDSANNANSLAFITGASWAIGTSGTLVRVNTSGATTYRDNYEQGLINIPATANWIIRGSSTINVLFTTATGTTGSFPSASYYPNLTFESGNGLWDPTSVSSKFSGNLSTANIKGNLDIGGSGAGTVKIYNENYFGSPILVEGGLTVRAGSTLTNAGTISGTGFEVQKDIMIDGTLTLNEGNSGLLKLSGATDQAINGSGINNMNIDSLEIDKATGKVINNREVNVYRVFSLLNSSHLEFGTGDIAIKSTAAVTGRVSAISSGVITYPLDGRFIVERYIASHSRAWQFLATPTSGPQTINEAWQEGMGPNVVGANNLGTMINGTTGGAGFFDGIAGPGVFLKTYIPSTDQWSTGPTPNSTHSPVNNPQGWMLFVRGDRNNTQTTSTPGNATVLRTRGKLYAPGNVPYSVATEPGKYATVGNPYASAIDLRTLDTAKITGDIYIWDPTLGGGIYGFGRYRFLAKVGNPGSEHYETFSDGAGGYPNTIVNEIQSGQAFFIKAQPGQVGTLSFKETNKVGTSNLVNRGGAGGTGETELLRVNLSTKNTDASQELLDGALAIFGNFSRDLDWHDGVKLMNGGENIGFRVQNQLSAIERRPSPVSGDTLQLELSGTRPVAYQWEVTAEHMNVPGRSGWMYDKYLHQNTPLNLDGTTSIDFTVTSDPLSAAVNRFRIVFQKITAPLPVKFISITAVRNADRSIKVQWKVDNEINITGYVVERSANGQNFSGILSADAASVSNYNKNDLSPLAADNYYRIKATGNGGDITYSDIVKVAPLPVKASISLYPNPVEGKTAQVIFTNQPEGIYSIQVINKLGQAIYSGTTKVTGYNFVKQIVLGSNVAQGSYEVKVINAEGKVSAQQVVVN